MADTTPPTLDTEVIVRNLPKNFFLKPIEIQKKKDELKREMELLVKSVSDHKLQSDILYEIEELKTTLSKSDGILNSIRNEISNDVKKDASGRSDVEKKLSGYTQDFIANIPNLLDCREKLPVYSSKLADLSIKEVMKVIENVETKTLVTFSKMFVFQEISKLFSCSSELNTSFKDLGNAFKKGIAKGDKSLKAAINDTYKAYESGLESLHTALDRTTTKVWMLIKKANLETQLSEVKKYSKQFRSDVDAINKSATSLRSKGPQVTNVLGEHIENLKKIMENICESFSNLTKTIEEQDEIDSICKLMEKYRDQFSEKFNDIRIDSVCAYIPESSTDINHLMNIKISVSSVSSVAYMIAKSKSLKCVDPAIGEYWDNLKTVLQTQWIKVLGERLEVASKLFECAQGWSKYIGELFCIKYQLGYVQYVVNVDELQLPEQQTRVLDYALRKYNDLKVRIKNLSLTFNVGKDEDEFIHLIISLQKEMQDSFFDVGKKLKEKRLKYLHTVCFSSYTQQLTFLEGVLREKESTVNSLISNPSTDAKLMEIAVNQLQIMCMEVEAFDSIVKSMREHVGDYLSQLVEQPKVVEIKERIDALQLTIGELLRKVREQIETTQSVLSVDDLKNESDKLLMMASVVQATGESLLNVDNSHPVLDLSSKSATLADLIAENSQKVENLIKIANDPENAERHSQVDLDEFSSQIVARHKACETALTKLKESLPVLEKYQLFEKHSRKLCLWLSFMVKMMNHGGLGGCLSESQSMYKIHLETYHVVQNIDKLVSAIQEKAEDMIMSGNPCSHGYRKSVQSINESQNQLLIAYYYRETNLESAMAMYNWITEISVLRSWVKNLTNRMDSIAETTDETTLKRETEILEEYLDELENKRLTLKQFIAGEKLLKYPLTLNEKTSNVLIGTKTVSPQFEHEMPIEKDHVYFLICEYDKKLVLISDGCRNGYASMENLRQDCCSSDISHELCSFPTSKAMQELTVLCNNDIDAATAKANKNLTRIKNLHTQLGLMNLMEGLNLWIEAKKTFFATETAGMKEWNSEMAIQKLTCIKIEMIKKKTSLLSLGDQCMKFKETYSCPVFEEMKIKVENNFSSLDTTYTDVVNSFDEEIRVAIENRILLYWLNTIKKQQAQLQVMIHEVDKSPDLKKVKERLEKMDFLGVVVENQFSDWLVANPEKSNDEAALQLKKTLEGFHVSHKNVSDKIDALLKLNDFVVLMEPLKIILMTNLSEFNQRYDMDESYMIEVRKNTHKDFVEDTKKTINSLEAELKEHEALLQCSHIETQSQREFDSIRDTIDLVEKSISDKNDYMNDYIAWNEFRQQASNLLQWMKIKEEVFKRCGEQEDEATNRTLKRNIEMVRNKKAKYDEIIELGNELIMAETFAREEMIKLQNTCKTKWAELQKSMYSSKFTFLSEKNLKNMAYKIDQQCAWLNNRIKQFADRPKFDFEEFDTQRHSFDLLVTDSNGHLANIASHIYSLNDLFQYVDPSTAGVIPEKLKKLSDLAEELKASIKRQKDAYDNGAKLSECYSKVCGYIVQIEDLDHKISRCCEPNVTRMNAKMDLIKNTVSDIEDRLGEERKACKKTGCDSEANNVVIKKIDDFLEKIKTMHARIDAMKQFYKTTTPVETANQEMDLHYQRLVRSVFFINQVKHDEPDDQQKISEVLTQIGTHINAEHNASNALQDTLVQAEESFDKLSGLSDGFETEDDQKNMKQMLKQYRANYDGKKALLDKIREEFSRLHQEVNAKYSGALSSIQSNLALTDLEEWTLKKLKTLTEMPEPSSEQTLGLMRLDLDETERQLREKEIILTVQEEQQSVNDPHCNRSKILEGVRTKLDMVKKRLNENQIKCELYEAECMYNKNFGAIDVWIADKSPTIPTNANYAAMDLPQVMAEKANMMVLQNDLKKFHESNVENGNAILDELSQKYPHSRAFLNSKHNELMARWNKFTEKLAIHFRNVEGAQGSQVTLNDLMQRFAKLATEFCAGYDSITEKFSCPADSLSEAEFKNKLNQFESLLAQEQILKEFYDDLLDIQEKIEEISSDAHNPHTWYTIQAIGDMWNSLSLMTVDKKAEYAREKDRIVRRMADETKYSTLLKSINDDMDECHRLTTTSEYTFESMLNAFQTSVLCLRKIPSKLDEILDLEFHITLNASCLLKEQRETSGFVQAKNRYQRMRTRYENLMNLLNDLETEVGKNPKLSETLKEVAQVLNEHVQAHGVIIKWTDVVGLIEKCSQLSLNVEKTLLMETIDRIVQVYQQDILNYPDVEPVTFICICQFVFKALNTGFANTKDILDAFMIVSQGDGKISEFELYQALGRELAEFCLARAKLLNLNGGELDLDGEGFDSEAFCKGMFTVLDHPTPVDATKQS